MKKRIRLGLQFFANIETSTNTMVSNTPTYLNTNTTGELTTEMKTFYDKQLIREAGPNLVHDQFGQKRPIPRGNGKTVEFRKFATLPKALTPLTEGITPNGRKLGVSAITATVSQYGDYITLSDLLELTAIDNVVAESVEQIGKQAGLTLDTIVRDIINGGTNVQYAPKINGTTETSVSVRSGLDTTALLTVEQVKIAVAKLRKNNAPTFADGMYVGIIHPHVALDLMNDSEWKAPHEYVDTKNIYRGEIGSIGGVRFVQSSEAKIFYGADLASDVRNLAVNNAQGYTAATTLAFDGSTAGVAANALKGREVIIGTTHATVVSNTTSAITVDTAITCADNSVIYPGEGASAGMAAYSTLILGKNAYGVTDIEGGGLETIIKQKGSGNDPLNQRSTIGWKATKTAERLVELYMIRIESCSKRFSATATAN